MKPQEFEVKSGQIIITDLCYDINPKTDRKINQILPAENGIWIYEKEMKDHLILSITCHHKDTTTKEYIKYGTVCVDSGTMSIMDLNTFKDFKKIPWEDYVANKIKDIQMDIYKKGGVIADSFGGDGNYDLYINNPEEVYFVKIVFHKE